jgi:hypothetical protein
MSDDATEQDAALTGVRTVEGERTLEVDVVHLLVCAKMAGTAA